MFESSYWLTTASDPVNWPLIAALLTALATVIGLMLQLAKARRTAETARIDAQIDARIEATIRPMIEEVKDAIASSDQLRIEQHHQNDKRLSLLEQAIEDRKHRREP